MRSVGPLSMFTLDERPEFARNVARLSGRIWQGAEFIQHDEVVNRYWGGLFDLFAAFQLVLCDEAGTVVAAGQTIPLAWDGTVADLPSGVGAVLERATRDRGTRPPNTLSALLALVEPERQGDGLSRQVLAGMKAIAARRGFSTLIAPVRPTCEEPVSAGSHGALHPLDSARWRARSIPGCARTGGSERRSWPSLPSSMLVTGTVAEWEGWTGMAFPESGDYVVPAALVPVRIDRERDLGRYEEPNVWMRHPSRPADAWAAGRLPVRLSHPGRLGP